MSSINTTDDHTIRANRPVFDLQQIPRFSYGTAFKTRHSQATTDSLRIPGLGSFSFQGMPGGPLDISVN
jgi:hypothetical protein